MLNHYTMIHIPVVDVESGNPLTVKNLIYIVVVKKLIKIKNSIY